MTAPLLAVRFATAGAPTEVKPTRALLVAVRLPFTTALPISMFKSPVIVTWLLNWAVPTMVVC